MVQELEMRGILAVNLHGERLSVSWLFSWGFPGRREGGKKKVPYMSSYKTQSALMGQPAAMLPLPV